MPITAELLRAKIAEMQATVTLHQGAIQFAEFLLNELEGDGDDALSMEQVAEMVGGPGATAEVGESE